MKGEGALRAHAAHFLQPTPSRLTNPSTRASPRLSPPPRGRLTPGTTHPHSRITTPTHPRSFDAPLCSTCTTLADFVPPSTAGGAALTADCAACCTPDTDATAAASAPLAARAVLEVCDSQLRRHAHIQGFLDREVKKFGAGKISHVSRWGMPPRLLLNDEGGHLLEAVRIDGWKTEHIVEYLSARLVGGAGVTATA